MTSEDKASNVVELDDARARRDAIELSADQFKHSGAHLASVREAIGLSLSDAANRTHIKLIHLEAIEEMRTNDLPPRPYAIGFVKTYAEFLGMDAVTIVERFKIDAGFSAPAPVEEAEKFVATETAGSEEKAELSLYAVVAIIAFILWCAFQITLPTRSVTPLNVGANARSVESVSDATIGVATVEINDAPAIAPVERVEPVYPRSCAENAQILETVDVVFTVTPEGRVAAEKIDQSSNSCFNAAALNALRRWQFSPDAVDGLARSALSQRLRFEFPRP